MANNIGRFGQALGGQRLVEPLGKREVDGAQRRRQRTGERECDESEIGYNVNPKMRFKANFPPSSSQTSEHNFSHFLVAINRAKPGTIFPSEKSPRGFRASAPAGPGNGSSASFAACGQDYAWRKLKQNMRGPRVPDGLIGGAGRPFPAHRADNWRPRPENPGQ